MPEYAYLSRILNMPWVLNFQNSEYGRVHNMNVTQHSEYDTIYLNMSEFTILDRVLNVSYNT